MRFHYICTILMFFCKMIGAESVYLAMGILIDILWVQLGPLCTHQWFASLYTGILRRVYRLIVLYNRTNHWLTTIERLADPECGPGSQYNRCYVITGSGEEL